MNNFAAARGGADRDGAAAAAVLGLIRKSADALLASHKNAEGHPRPSLPSLPFLPGSPVVIENSAHDGI